MSRCECTPREKHRSADERQALQNRLRRIEGQVRGLQNMLEQDAYCTDILTQVSAVQAALGAFSRQLLDEHIRTCVVQDIRQGQDDVIDDLIQTIHHMMR